MALRLCHLGNQYALSFYVKGTKKMLQIKIKSADKNKSIDTFLLATAKWYVTNRVNSIFEI